VDPADIIRFKQLGAIAVTQPYWFMEDDYYYNLQVPYLGQKRADEEYPMEIFFKAGVVVTSSSDYPVTIPCNPLVAIQTGILRSIPDTDDPSQILWPEERATLDQMIASFTTNGAYALFCERETGSIEKGKWADFIILNRNLLKIPADSIRHAKVLRTFVEGREEYTAQEAR
jgi:predicted amidohydrolase YtcJ